MQVKVKIFSGFKMVVLIVELSKGVGLVDDFVREIQQAENVARLAADSFMARFAGILGKVNRPPKFAIATDSLPCCVFGSVGFEGGDFATWEKDEIIAWAEKRGYKALDSSSEETKEEKTMIDESRKDRAYLWGRIFGELSLWMDRAKKLAPTQKDHMLDGWDVRPLATFTKWQEQYRLTVAEAGAPAGEEDRRIGEIMWNMTPETATDNSPLGADCWRGFYHERGAAHSPEKDVQNN